MANGKELGKINLSLFNNWLSDRELNSDWANYIRGNKINRTEICRECGFSNNVFKKAPLGNKEITDRLYKVELELKEKGIIKDKKVADPVAVEKASENKSRIIEAKLNQLEQENALLKSELQKNKKEQKRYDLFMEHLRDTGLMPR